MAENPREATRPGTKIPGELSILTPIFEQNETIA